MMVTGLSCHICVALLYFTYLPEEGYIIVQKLDGGNKYLFHMGDITILENYFRQLMILFVN